MGCLEVEGLEAVLLRSLEARLAGPPGTLEAWPGGDVPTATGQNMIVLWRVQHNMVKHMVDESRPQNNMVKQMVFPWRAQNNMVQNMVDKSRPQNKVL